MARPKLYDDGEHISLGTMVLPTDVIANMKRLAGPAGGMAAVVRAALVAVYGDADPTTPSTPSAEDF